jgi:hypothetical protein
VGDGYPVGSVEPGRDRQIFCIKRSWFGSANLDEVLKRLLGQDTYFWGNIDFLGKAEGFASLSDYCSPAARCRD